MKFKAGDRIRTIARPEITATVRSVDKEFVYLELDKILKHKGKQVKLGHLTHKEAEEIFELTEKSDWTSIWDDSSS